ncbi:pyruvate kinase [Clostridium massiliodielmoense]|uniref:pyruvate kinase n=1 Tax=Clostridium massiliodielmoense TaxID=1776385 RepID=UPI000166A5B7|nr:pyruvate kinase [Clostridium massiliodielmoense]EDS78654.1 pyruvate kinase [Clostridium botulinum C str. Eklund]KEH99324.1 pyruvate kinase [Clostridium botulinum C/D str. BKT12695]NEZ49208.1 pyruvate kinase [Clostridium botulinum]
MQRTKMVFTIGPASENKEYLRELILAGMSAARLNFSHGDFEEHGARIKTIRELRKELNKQVAIVLDTKGPEIRTKEFEGKVQLVKGSKFTVYCTEDVMGDATKCTITYADLYKDVKPGNTILIDDGLVALTVESIEDTKIHCVVANDGVVSSKKGVNVPNVSIKLPAITEKDKGDLIFGCEQEVDMVAASFIRKADDVKAIRKVLEEHGGSHIRIFSKIENQEGVDNVDEILEASDGIMVARGDMGVEIPIEQVPIVQKMIINKCNKAGKPVITATQMLDSMIRNPRPTRAEASDVANAIFDGTDATMLSGESANGDYPIQAAQTMAKIAQTAEKYVDHKAALEKRKAEKVTNVADAISLSACESAMELNAAAIIVPTKSGNTAKMIAKYRPACPIIAVTPEDKITRRLSLSCGVYPLTATSFNSTDEMIEKSVAFAKEAGHVKDGDTVIVAAGLPIHESGTTNMIKVHVVGK